MTIRTISIGKAEPARGGCDERPYTVRCFAVFEDARPYFALARHHYAWKFPPDGTEALKKDPSLAENERFVGEALVHHLYFSPRAIRFKEAFTEYLVFCRIPEIPDRAPDVTEGEVRIWIERTGR
jgi:hypothetical protein